MPNIVRPRGSIVLVALAVAMQSVRTNSYLSRPFASRLVLTRNSFFARSEFSDSADNHDDTVRFGGPSASDRSADDSPVTRSDSKPDDILSDSKPDDTLSDTKTDASPDTRSDSKTDVSSDSKTENGSSESKPDDESSESKPDVSSVIHAVGTPDAPALIYPVGNAVIYPVGTPDAPALIHPVIDAIIYPVGTSDAPALIHPVGKTKR